MKVYLVESQEYDGDVGTPNHHGIFSSVEGAKNYIISEKLGVMSRGLSWKEREFTSQYNYSDKLIYWTRGKNPYYYIEYNIYEFELQEEQL